ERRRILDADVDLDADRLQLLLEDLAALHTRRPGGSGEAEFSFVATAGPDLAVAVAGRRGAARAPVLLEQLDRSLGVVVVLVEVGELARGVRADLVLGVVQRLQAGGDRAVQR